MDILMANHMDIHMEKDIPCIIINAIVAMDSIANTADPLFHLNSDLSGIPMRALKW